jgi:hypothetical protein
MGKNAKDMRRRPILFAFLGILALSGCTLSPDVHGIKVFTVHSDLTQSIDDWTGDFTGYPATPEDSVAYGLQVQYTNLPGSLSDHKGLMLTGNNKSGELFMFIKNKVTGLTPNTDYSLAFEVQFATSAPVPEDGQNGSPGNSVFMKAGACSWEPKKIIEGNQCELNVDKGSVQSLPGSEMLVLGNIATPSADSYAVLTRSNGSYSAPLIVHSNSKGEIWLIVGTDSAYKGTTTIYYTSVDVILTVPD